MATRVARQRSARATKTVQARVTRALPTLFITSPRSVWRTEMEQGHREVAEEGPTSAALSADDGALLPEVMTVDELAALLRLNRKTVYAAISRGEIPGVRRLGDVIRISRATVLRWLAEGQGRVSRSRRTR